MDDLDDAAQKADGEAGSILALVSQFDALAEKEGRSEEDKVRLKAVTDELNASVEGLNISYDIGNDSLSATAEAVDAVCRAEADRLRYAQKMEEIPELLIEEAEKSELVAKTKEELEAAEKRLDAAYGDATGTVRENAEATGELRVSMSQMKSGADAARGEVSKLTSELETQEGELKETRDKLRAAEESAARFATAQTALAAAASAVAAGMDAEAAAALYGVDAAELAAKTASDEAVAQEELAQKLNETEQAITDYVGAHPAFRDALEKSGLTVSGFSDLLVAQGIGFDDAAKQIEDYSARAASGFDKVADSSKNTLDALYETLAYNLEATQNWGDNLQAVFGRTGVSFSEEFVDAVREGGVEEYGTVMAQMRDLSDSELQAISDAYARNGQTGVDNWLAEQRLLVPGTKEALDGTGAAVDEALAGGEAAAGQSGADTGAAYTGELAEAIAGCPEEVRSYIAQLEGELAAAAGPAAEAGAGTGGAYAAGLGTAIASCPAEVQGYIAQLEGKLRAFQGGAASIGTDTGAGYGSGAAAGIGAQQSTAAAAAAGLRGAVELELAPLPLYGTDAGSAAGSNLAGGLDGKAGMVDAAAKGLKKATEDPLASIDGGKYGSGASGAFSEGIARNKAAVLLNAVAMIEFRMQWAQLARDAFGWGNDAGRNFGDGLRYSTGYARAQAEALAASIRAVLHFSVPDEGPLSDADEYGPDFVMLFADGMRSRIGALRAASAEAAQAIADGMGAAYSGNLASKFEAVRGTGADMAAAAYAGVGAGCVTNNYYTIERLDASGDPAVRKATGDLWGAVRRYSRTGV